MKVVPFIYEDEDDLMANTCIVIDNNDCVAIDPSKAYDGIVKFIEKNNLTLKAVLLTHGHFDHTRGVEILLHQYQVPLYIGFYDEDYLTSPYKNLSAFMKDGPHSLSVEATTISDKEIIRELKEDIEVIETPFHTRGSVCYYLKDSGVLFSGDTLFKSSIGRDDFPGSCPKEKDRSLSKLMNLPDDVKVYPGHGLFTFIGEEKKYNPFVKR